MTIQANTVGPNKTGLQPCLLTSDQSKLPQDRDWPRIPAQDLSWSPSHSLNTPSLWTMQISSVQKTGNLKHSLTFLFWRFTLWLENSLRLKTHDP